MTGIRGHKYVVLLALLVVALAIETFGVQSGAERLRSDALRTVVGVVLWIVVFEHRSAHRQPVPRAFLAQSAAMPSPAAGGGR